MNEQHRNGATHDRRSFLRAAGGAGLVSGLAGCSGLVDGTGTNGASGATAGTTRTTGTVQLELVDVAGNRSPEQFQPAVDELGERFGTTVELQYTEIPFSNMKRQLFTRIGGGNAPDVAAVDQIWLGAFVDSGKLMRLDDVSTSIEFEDYLDPFAEAVQYRDHVYGFPISTDVRGMYWNKRKFEAAGLDPERPPQAWDELFDVAQRLHDPPETYGSVYFVVAGRWLVSLFAAGGDVLSADGTGPRFDSQAGVEAARFVDRLYNEVGVCPPDPVYRDGASMARKFLDGQYAIDIVEGSWLDYFWRNLGHSNEAMRERFGFAPTPPPAHGTARTMSGGFVWTGFETTDHPKLVREFLRIVASKSFSRQLAIETNDIPTRESLLDDTEIWKNVLYGETIKEMLEHTRTRPIRNWSTVAEHLNPALQRVAYDKADPETALATASEQVRNALAGGSTASHREQ